MIALLIAIAAAVHPLFELWKAMEGADSRSGD